MRKCETCGANLDSGERCDCEHDREKLDRACWMIAEAISTMRMADGLLRECGIEPCPTLDYAYDIMDRTYARPTQIRWGKGACGRISGGQGTGEPLSNDMIRAATVYRGLKNIELQREGT